MQKQLKKIKNIKSWFVVESTTKYGVGVEDQFHTMHVPPRDAKLKSYCSCMLNVIVDYLLLQKFMDVIMDKWCDGNGGTWTNNESIMSLFRSLLSLQQQKPIVHDDDDSDAILLLGKWPHKVDHTQEILSFCTIQIHQVFSEMGQNWLICNLYCFGKKGLVD